MPCMIHFAYPGAADVLADPNLYVLDQGDLIGLEGWSRNLVFGPQAWITYVDRSDTCLHPLDDGGVCLLSKPHGGVHTDFVFGCDGCDRYMDADLIEHHTYLDSAGDPDVTQCEFCFGHGVPLDQRVEAEDHRYRVWEAFQFCWMLNDVVLPVLGLPRARVLSEPR